MNDEVLIVSLDQQELWSEINRTKGLPSQSWHYCWALSAFGIQARLAVVRVKSACMVIPFFVREWSGSFDVCTVLSLSGSSAEGSSQRPLCLWREFAKDQRWVAGYIQFAPNSLITAPPTDQVRISNWVFLLDLGINDPLSRASTIIRRKVRHASRAGAMLVDDRAVLADALVSLYPATVKRVGASAAYSFSTQTLRCWASDQSNVLLGASIKGSIEAVILLLTAASQAEYQIGASSEQGRGLFAWLLSLRIGTLQEMGVKTLNLGGGVRAGDGLYQFKEKFGGTLSPLKAVQQIYDEDRYNDLCRAADITEPVEWFPAYRANPASTRATQQQQL